eukprot:TRINITY_DN722_c0_g1_i6.p1 TRINITY_DN722_c0_g1~~TRINITY_DN722_c0_g1_i6.p1  ORF type:complete len:1637 (+),score=419.07 TRINITY_DN722_c0_g1_i6:175-5085(+)
MDEDREHHFLVDGLPVFSSCLMSRGRMAPKLRPLVMTVLQGTLRVVAGRLTSDLNELYDTLRLVFSSQPYWRHLRNLETEYNLPSVSDAPTLFVKPKMTHTLQRRDTPFPNDFFCIVNYFGSVGGFEKLYGRVNGTCPRPSMYHLHSVVTTLNALKYEPGNSFYTSDLLCGFFPEFLDAVYDQLLFYQFKPATNAEKTQFTNTYKTTYELLRLAHTDDECVEIDCIFQLKVNLTKFNSSQLESKIKALKGFGSQINRITKSKPGVLAFISQSRAVPPESVLKWFRDNDIANRLCAEAHPELLYNMADMLGFLSQHGQLTKEHINRLWEQAMGKHESTKHAIYSALLRLLPHLSGADVSSVFLKLKEMPVEEHDAESVSMLYQLIPKVREKDALQGTDTLWALIQDDSKASPAVYHAAFDKLALLCSRPLFTEQSMRYLSQCAENVERGSSVCVSLKLLKIVLHSFKKSRVAATIEGLNRKYELLHHVVSDTVKYKLLAESKLSTMRGEYTDYDPRLNELCLIGCVRHLEQIKLRLEFLHFVLQNSTLNFNLAQLRSLTDKLVLSAITHEEQELYLSWLTHTMMPSDVLRTGTGSVPSGIAWEGTTRGFPDDVLQRLYTEQVLSFIDVVSLSMTGFELFHRLFLYVGVKRGMLALPERSGDCAAQDDLQPYNISTQPDGMAPLWTIATEASDERVGQAAINVLNNLHRGVSPDSLKGTNRKIREQYVETCTNYMMQESHASSPLQAVMNIHESNNPVSYLQLQRCLALLKAFLQDWDEREIRQAQGKPSSAVGKPIQLQLQDMLKTGEQDEPKHKSRRARYWNLISSKLISKGEISFSQIYADFFDEFERRRVPSPTAQSTTPPPPKLPKILATVTVCTTDTLSTLRARAAEALAAKVYTPNFDTVLQETKVALFLGNRELCEDDKTVEYLRDGQMLAVRYEVVEKVAELPDTQYPGRLSLLSKPKQIAAHPAPRRDPRHQPAAVMMQCICKDFLYNLLQTEFADTAASDRFGYQCWDLLHCLPPAEELRQNLSVAQEFAKYLNPANPYLLMYSLSIIAGCVADDPERRWGRNFVGAGGVAYLTSTLKSIDESMPLPRARKLLHLVLSALHPLLLDTSTRGPVLHVRQETGGLFDLTLFAKLLSLLCYMLCDPRAVAVADAEGSECVRQGMQLANAHMLVCEPGSIATAPFPFYTCFCEYVSGHDWLFQLLLAAPQQSVRTEIANAIFSLSTCFPAQAGVPQSPATFFTGLLLSQLTKIENSYPKSCESFFTLLNRLLHVMIDTKQPLCGQDLVGQLSGNIFNHKTCEVSKTSDPDQVLIGFLTVMHTLLVAFPFKYPDLLLEIFNNCLFFVPSMENRGCVTERQVGPPKCKTDESRRAAFLLLLELCHENPENFKMLLRLLESQHCKLELADEWQYVPSEHERAKYGHVGLRNQGATCYMNSVLQQLFHIPCFRRGILSAHCVSQPDEQESVDVLQQLQILFANLQSSSARYYDTIRFCATIRDFEGNPIATTQQMDADDFLKTLFDKLETALKPIQTHRDLLKSVFGGVLCNQLICKECPHRYERAEGCFSLSVEIKNKKNLVEALQLFVEGEMLTGDNAYMCEQCGRRIATLKRSCVELLPHTLVIHLKRFEFK